MRAPAAVLVLLVVAGCLGAAPPEAPATPATSPVSGTPTSESPPVAVVARGLLPAEGRAVEPGIEVAPDGTIYVTAAAGLGTRASWLWISRDGGATWEDVPPVSAEAGVRDAPFGAEGDLALDPDGNVYFTELMHLVGAPVTRSTDGGRTWELRSANAFAVPAGDREWIAAGEDGLVVVTWNHQLTGFWVAVSEDGGRTFPTQTWIPGYEAYSLEEETPLTTPGPVAIGRGGEVFIAKSTEEGVSLFTSLDRGKTFARTTVRATAAPTEFIVVSVAVDTAGSVYVAWVEPVDGNTETWYAASRDGGATFLPPVRVSDGRGSTVMPWIAARGPGEVAIAWHEASDRLGLPAAVRGAWWPHVAVVSGADTDAPRVSVAVAAEEPARRGAVCTEGSHCGGDRELADFFQVAYAADGIHVVWSDDAQRSHWARLAGP